MIYGPLNSGNFPCLTRSPETPFSLFASQAVVLRSGFGQVEGVACRQWRLYAGVDVPVVQGTFSTGQTSFTSIPLLDHRRAHLQRHHNQRLSENTRLPRPQ